MQIKSKVVKATLANKDVLDMFHGVLGTSEGSAQLPVTYPKYLRIARHTERFLTLLEMFRDSTLVGRFPDTRSLVAGYAAALRGQYAREFSAPDFEPWLGVSAAHLAAGVSPPGGAGAYGSVPPEEVARFNEAFAAVKKCPLVNLAIQACSNLVRHKKSLQDPDALNPKFLIRDSGNSFAPLPDLPVNFKKLYIDSGLNDDDRRYIMVILHKLYTIGHDVYEAVSSPDVNVDEFADVVMNSLADVRKMIPRCDAAFNKIAASVDLLKGNFGDYYKDFAASGNPTIIMENFVIDVSRDTTASPAVTAQFRKIISHYRKLAAQQATNPKLKGLFAQVDANFKELEKQSRSADDEDEPSSDDDDDADLPAPDLVAGPGPGPGPCDAGASDDAARAGGPPATPAEPPAAAALGPDGKPLSKAARKRARRAALASGPAAPPAPAPAPAPDPASGAPSADEPSLADEFDGADSEPPRD